MSTLLLIRHGQATAFEADSDRLTDLGKRQAQTLGEYLVRHRFEFDEALMGSMRRHRETAQAVADAYRAAGLTLPEPTIVPGWNEYDGPAITTVLARKLGAEDASFAKLVAEFRAKEHDPRERNRYFQRMFEALMTRWISGDLVDPEVESFAAFYERASGAYTQVLNGDGSRRVIVFTSGGPIGVCVQRTVSAPPGVSIELNWRVRNTSLTELIFSKGRASLDSFNHVPHLEDVALRSFR